MSKLTTELVERTAKQVGVPEDMSKRLIGLLLDITEDEDEKVPSIKKQYAILISDPDGILPDTDLVGWVVQVPEEEYVATAQDRINRAVYEYNATKKGGQYPCSTVGDACDGIPSKHFKEAGIWIKTKTPVLMLRTNNKIPLEKSEV